MANAQIIFDEPTAIFMPGQNITGRVLFVSRNPVDISSVKIQFRGKCKISWKKWGREYIGRQVYLENEITLVRDKGKSRLEVCKYVYPFKFFLPHHTPSSFACKYGYIRFIAKVEIYIPWRLIVKKKVMFEVLSPINLNKKPSLSNPQRALKKKSYFYGCFISGSMKLIAHIPYSGLVPGQTLPVTVKLENNLNVDVDNIIIRLERKWKAPIQMYKKSDIVKKVIKGAKKHTSITRVVQIQIPDSLMILNFEYCKVITDTFTLHVEACGHAKISFNVMLGNIPLRTFSNLHQVDHSFKLSNQKYWSNEPIPENFFPFV